MTVNTSSAGLGKGVLFEGVVELDVDDWQILVYD